MSAPQTAFSPRPGLKTRLTGRNCEALMPYLGAYQLELLAPEDPTPAELIISSGGDGSLLGAERDYPYIPKLAIRDRAHNPKCPRHGEQELLAAFFADRLPGRRIAHIQATGRDGTLIVEGINDIVITRPVQSAAIRCRLGCGGETLRTQVISDGIVFCTAFGSTGYFQSITRGSFCSGLGVAYSNPMDGNSFTVLGEDAELTVQLLRGPALMLADNAPRLISLKDGDQLTVSLSTRRTVLYGLEAFRCAECYRLRSCGCSATAETP